ncbi:15955_t:CDS:2, partial [Dentiscutata heterogama]
VVRSAGDKLEASSTTSEAIFRGDVSCSTTLVKNILGVTSLMKYLSDYEDDVENYLPGFVVEQETSPLNMASEVVELAFSLLLALPTTTQIT